MPQSVPSSDQVQPVCSVVIPAFEARATIGPAVESVLENESALEVLVVDDGSNDPITNNDVPTERVRLLRLPVNGGTARARNHAILHARGSWIAFLDADDTYEPNRIDALMSFLASRDLDGVATDTIVVEANGTSRTTGPTPNGEGLLHLRTSCVFGSHILARSLFEKVGLFDPHWRIQEDADLWLRMILSGARIGYQPGPAYIYKLNEQGKTLGRSAIKGLHEFRNIHLANALRPGRTLRDRLILLARAGKWEGRALPHHVAALKR
jgi:glycosyltransferase involved in cell wall biosynthesis